MKTALCFVLLLSALVAVQAACDFNDINGLVTESTNRATAISTACANVDVNLCKGDCWDAIESYYTWFEGCYDEVEELGVLYIRDAIDLIRNAFQCDGNGGSIGDFGQIFTCIQNGDKTDDLVNAATNVGEVCASEASDSICSKKCYEAIVKYQDLLFECYSFDGATDNLDLTGTRGYLETLCEIIDPHAACLQVGASRIIAVQETCALASGADGLQCSGDCRAAIAAVESTTNERCFDWGSELLESWKDLCDPECGPKAFQAYLEAMSACDDINWTTVDGCPADCSEKIDIASELVGCFPGTNMMRRTVESIKVLKDDVCAANPTSSPGSACVLNEMSELRSENKPNDWAYLLRYCRQDNHCSNECRKEVNAYMKTAKDCYDDELGLLSQPGDVKDALKNVRGACSNGNNMMNLQLTGISRQEILGNLNDFLRRVALATNTLLENLILIAVEYIEDATTRDGETSVSIEYSGKEINQEESQANLGKYGLQGTVAEGEEVDSRSNDGSPASSLIASVFTIVAVVTVALLH